MENKLSLKLFNETYGICRLGSSEEFPIWAKGEEFISVTKTKDELSIVCLEEGIPSDVKCERDWRILKVLGPLDLSLIGVLAEISTLLADVKVSIFAISTFDTDYILIKNKDVNRAAEVLSSNGYNVI